MGWPVSLGTLSPSAVPSETGFCHCIMCTGHPHVMRASYENTGLPHVMRASYENTELPHVMQASYENTGLPHVMRASYENTEYDPDDE